MKTADLAFDGLSVVYDGDCPFCRTYVQMLRLREATGEVRLINARMEPELTEELRRSGADLDQGMFLAYGGNNYYGEAAVHLLACLSSPAGWLNRIASALLRRRLIAKFLYPVLRVGRALTLQVLRREKLSARA